MLGRTLKSRYTTDGVCPRLCRGGSRSYFFLRETLRESSGMFDRKTSFFVIEFDNNWQKISKKYINGIIDILKKQSIP